MASLEEIARNTKKDVFDYMVITRGNKVKRIINGLNSFKFINLLFTRPALSAYRKALKRAELLKSYYVLMRFIDDIVDLDAELPPEFKDTEEFVESKLRFVDSYTSFDFAEPKDVVDSMMAYCFRLARECEFDISSETRDILSSMLFDARRVNYARTNGVNQVFLESELRHHFYMLDIRGTIRGSLKIFNEDPSKFVLLQPLGEAERTCYNLRDLGSDLSNGIVNITREDCQRYNIPIGSLESRDYVREIASSAQLPKSIQAWTLGEAKRGLELIETHNQIMRHNRFRTLGRLTLPVMYKNPSYRYFRSVLDSR